MAADAAAARAVLGRFTAAGIDLAALGDELQVKGAASFVASWTSLLERIQAKLGEVAPAA
jgi:transaldolase